MKKTVLFLLLMLSGMAGAQIVNIPDAGFKNELLQASANNHVAKNNSGQWMDIDGNNDNEIQESEAAAVWELYIDNNTIFSLQGIETFLNIRVADIHCQYLEILNVETLSNLVTLNLTECENLQQLDASGLASLENLKIEYSGNLQNLNLDGAENLKNFSLIYSSVQVDFSQLPNIETIYLEEFNHSVDVSVNQYLKQFTVTGGDPAAITLGDKPVLTDLTLTPLTYNAPMLDVSGCTALVNLNMEFDFDAATYTRFINLKNGITDYENVSLYFSAYEESPLYICIDEGNEVLFPNTVINNTFIQISSYCSFTPGGNYNTIAGNFTFDSDNDGCSSNDSFNGFARVNIDNGTESGANFTSGAGHYDFYTQSGSFILTPQFENDWFTATPATATITLPNVNNTITTQNFCIAANGSHPDLEVVITPLANAVPGFEAYYKVVYKNKGNQALSGAVILNYDDSILHYVSAAPVGAATPGTLTWNYINLVPFESRSIIVTLNLNGPMDTPAVNLDDVLDFTVSVTPASGDETPADNTFTLNHIVVGSYDPNDVTCLEGDSVSTAQIGEYLHYNINFENTGTAPATFIVVKDIIDETKFDISSLQLLDASHTVQVRVNGNKAEFVFDAINLGPEATGNVVFKIKTLSALQANDNVKQQADIFFDYNFPIQTNEAVTTFETLSRGDFEIEDIVKVYPNPSKGIISISAGSDIKSVQFYDIQGRLLETAIINDTNTTIDLSSRASGMYFVKVTTGKGVKVENVIRE